MSGELDTCRLCGGQPSRPVVASWTFRVERDMPNQNDRVVNAGATRWRYANERRMWVACFVCAIKDHGLHGLESSTTHRRRRVTITRCYAGRQKLRDYGNLVGGSKPVIDAMVLCDFLVDDSPEWMECFYHQRRVPKDERGTLITIEEFA